MEPKIEHKEGTNRFETTVNGFTAYVEYCIKDNAIDILHTVVPPEIGGRGIAGQLVAAVYAYGDERGLARKASCSYAAAWLKRRNGTT